MYFLSILYYNNKYSTIEKKKERTVIKKILINSVVLHNRYSWLPFDF